MGTPYPTEDRVARLIPQADGSAVCRWNLTPSNRTDPVYVDQCIVKTLPIVFVPGIMGTNLCAKSDPKIKVWRLDTTYLPFLGDQMLGIFFNKLGQNSGMRQVLLHPDRTMVDPLGMVPSEPVGSILSDKQYTARGWGEVGSGSYHEFLLKLEKIFNGHRTGQSDTEVEAQIAQLMALRSDDDSAWRPQKELVPPDHKDYANLRDWYMPVYACGYNWLDDNANAAKYLQTRINAVITENNRGMSRCEQVILVTHSMGGLVARACQQLDGMVDKIAGVVHGVTEAHLKMIASRLLPYENAERAKPGFCMQGVLFFETGQDDETAIFNFDAKSLPDVFLSVDYHAVTGQPKSGLLQRKNDLYVDDPRMVTGLATLRERQTQLGGDPAEEALTKTTQSPVQHILGIERRDRLPRTLDRPFFGIHLTTGNGYRVHVPPGQKPPSDNGNHWSYSPRDQDAIHDADDASLSDEQVLKLWDEIVASVRKR